MIHPERWPTRPSPWPRRATAVCLFLLVLGAATAGHAQQRPTDRALGRIPAPSGVPLHDGVVAAPALGLVYLMAPDGAVEARALADGAVVWRSDAAARPLALSERGLLAQAEAADPGALPLVLLDARSGGVSERVEVALPPDLRATVVDTPGASFRARAASPGGELVVAWRAQALAPEGTARGFLPQGAEAPRVRAGAARLVHDAGATRVVEHEGSAFEPWRAGAFDELTDGARAGHAEGRRFRSADGGFVLASRRADGDPARLALWEWSLTTRDGDPIGALTASVAAAPFTVVGSTLYYVAPPAAQRSAGSVVSTGLTLRAVDLATGTQRWSAPLRDPIHRGPFAP